jgi:hypothetical protein
MVSSRSMLAATRHTASARPLSLLCMPRTTRPVAPTTASTCLNAHSFAGRPAFRFLGNIAPAKAAPEDAFATRKPAAAASANVQVATFALG